MTFSAVDLAAFFSIAKDASVIGMLLCILWGGARKVWVWGHHYTDAVQRLEDAQKTVEWWQERHLAVLETADRAVSLAGRGRTR